jgi:hypothetical protein
MEALRREFATPGKQESLFQLWANAIYSLQFALEQQSFEPALMRII